MGVRGSASGGGRYEDKGGQQVGSFFEEATDNEKIKAIYGNYNFWSWLRYWWLDTENYITFMLMDKGYYDYDYDKPSEKVMAVLHEIKSNDDLTTKLAKMGFGVAKPKPQSVDDAQRIVMAELRKKQ